MSRATELQKEKVVEKRRGEKKNFIHVHDVVSFNFKPRK